MKRHRILTPILVAALLSGCSFIPEYERPVLDTPAAWSEAKGTPTAIARDWWKNFNSAELDALMAQALSANNDLNAALARVDQARALARQAGSTLMPTVNASGNAGWQKINPGEGESTDDWTGDAGLTVGYELDLFGLNRAQLASAEQDVEGFKYASDATALIVMSDVAKGYFNVLNLKERLKIADQNLESALELLRIVQARFDAGATTLLDVSQQKSDLASTEASRAAIEQQYRLAHSSLAVLVGKAPQNLQIAGADLRNLAVPDIAPGQPSALLERRPDIRSAESDLRAADADIGAARSAFFPQVTIGLDAGIAATPLGDPATTTLSLLSGLTAPIFSGGLLEGQLDFAKARKLELVEDYRKTVLISFKDVEDALASEKAAQQREASLATALAESRKAYDLSKQQYDVGSIDFQTLLDTRQTMLLAEDNYVQTKNDRLAAAVNLYKSLGGGWAEQTTAAQTPAPVQPDVVPATPPEMFDGTAPPAKLPEDVKPAAPATTPNTL